MTPDGLPKPSRHGAVLAISLGTGLLVTDNSIATVALPTIAAELNVPAQAAVIVVTVYQLILLMALLPMSALGDRIGHKRLYQGGQVLFLAATVVTVLADSLPVLLIGRSLQALGVAASLSVGAVMLRAIYPAAQLGRGLGLNSVIIAAAAAFAPALGGLILAEASWRWVFAAAAPFAVLSLIAGALLPAPRRQSTDFDLAGAALCAASFGLIVGGVELAIHGGPPFMAGAVFVGGLALSALFVRREVRTERPILPVDLLGRPLLALAAAAALFAFVGSMSFMLSLPFRLQSEFGFPVEAVGQLMAVWPLAMLVSAPIAGVLSDRTPNGLLGGVGMILAAAGLTWLAFPPSEPRFVDLAPAMAMTGAGFGLFISPTARQIIGSAPRDRTASAGALVSTTRLLGQTLGASLLAALLAMSLADGPAPGLAAAACVGLAAAFSLLSFARRERSAPIDAADEPGI